MRSGARTKPHRKQLSTIKAMLSHPIRIKTALAALLLFLLTVPPVFAQARKPAAPNPKELHGGIEIGPKGIKCIAIRVAGADEGYEVKILYTELINTTLMQTRNNQFTPEALRDTGVAVQRFHQRMRQEYRVPLDQIYLVVSSSVIADNPQDLIAEISKRTNQSPTFLDVDTEAQLLIAGAVPKQYRVTQQGKPRWLDNRGISILVDIGSGNTKGGYVQFRQVTFGTTEPDYVTWGMPKGTVTFTNEISKSLGEATDYSAFAKRAQALSNDLLRVPLRSEVERKPGMINRRKVYLSGGIVWAMTTLLYPEERRSFTPLTVEDINRFYNRAITNPEGLFEPDLSRIPTATLRQEPEREVETVRNTFTPKNLIAGAEILRAVAAEMNLTGKQLLFARFGHLAWILSYVRLQAEQ
jgi:hypothetical protein